MSIPQRLLFKYCFTVYTYKRGFYENLKKTKIKEINQSRYIKEEITMIIKLIKGSFSTIRSCLSQNK